MSKETDTDATIEADELKQFLSSDDDDSALNDFDDNSDDDFEPEGEADDDLEDNDDFDAEDEEEGDEDEDKAEGDDDSQDTAAKNKSDERDNSSTTAPVTASVANASDNEPSLEDELKTGIKPDFIPGSKEFFLATAAEARAQIAKELGEFDEYDPEHIARFNYFVNEAQNNRKAEYQAAVEIIKNQREQRAAQKQQLAIQKQLDVEMEKILATPELKQRFGNLLKSMETNSRGDYLVLLEDLHHGKTDKLIKLAKKVAGPHGKLLAKSTNKARKAVTQPVKPKRSNDGVMTAADLGFL